MDGGGFAMKAAALCGLAPPHLFRHAFTAGVIGGVLYGMICRIALGHTGRALILPRFIVSAMVLLHVGVAVRVLVPWVSPSHYLLWIKLSGTTLVAQQHAPSHQLFMAQLPAAGQGMISGSAGASSESGGTSRTENSPVKAFRASINSRAAAA